MFARLSRNLQNQFTNYFFSTNRYLYFGANSAYAIGTGDFTIEFWLNCTSFSTNGFIQSDVLTTSTNNKWFVSYSGGMLRFGTHAAGGFSCTYTWAPSTNRWYHIAIVRSAGNIRFYIDGVQFTPVITGTPSSISLSQNGILLGAISPSTYSNSYFCNVRISTTAIYTGAFTPPSLKDPIAPVASTVLCAPLIEDINDYSSLNATISNSNNVSLASGSTATLGQVAREIVQVCTGQITNAINLQVFEKETSFINNTVASNWQLVFPSTITDSTNVFVLRSQCVTTSKYKYARFILKGTGSNEAFTEAKGGTANVYSKTDFTTVSIEVNSCISVNTSTGYCRNNSYYHASSEGYKPGTTELYISASHRHLLLYSEYNATSNTVPLFAVLEFPETNVTSTKNLIPALVYRGSGHALTNSVVSRDTTAITTPARNVCQIPDGYLVTTGRTAYLAPVFTNQSTDAKILTMDFGAAYTDTTNQDDRLPLGAQERKLLSRDLIFYDAKNAHQFLNMSTLTNVFFIPNSTQFCPLGFIYTNGTKNFMCLPLVTSVILIPME